MKPEDLTRLGAEKPGIMTSRYYDSETDCVVYIAHDGHNVPKGVSVVPADQLRGGSSEV